MHLGGELGISGVERVISVVSELADSERITIDGSELARTHPAVLVVLQTQLGETDRVRILGVSGTGLRRSGGPQLRRGAAAR